MATQSLDTENPSFLQAVAFVNQTNQPLFLTGKAGTGKTTFLKYIQQNCYKKMAITAPTGVAAMHAGGTTLHALFWLPFGTFIEDYPLLWDQEDSHIYNKSRLFSTIKLTKQRRAILQELELLVIDEVSMVRADTLDAIDVILKSVRRDMRPFGGLQVLFIGDLYQLPPVVRDHEWQVLRDHYSSPFFFDAKVLREYPPVILELQKIYRQKDDHFINVLNNIRNNKTTSEDLAQLNAYYRPDFIPSKDEQYITLTSHNRLADQLNQEALQHLPGKMFNLKAVVKDEFQQGSYPTEELLTLKEGAQVMFIKNDVGEDRKFYNGKIGTVKELKTDKHQIIVSFADGSDDVTVKRETWENIKYSYNKGDDKIEEEVMGTFSQYPLRLAWAITIHKSQGLTFDRAIIDAGTSFAAGQVYVALSRLRGLEGLVLRSQIAPHSIRTDGQVVNYMAQALASEQLRDVLQKGQRQYLGQILLQSFRWTNLVEVTEAQAKALEERNIDSKETALLFFATLLDDAKAQEKVANKFVTQLYNLFRDAANIDYSEIHNRTKSAVNWFLPKMTDELIDPLEKHIAEWQIKKRTKKYITELKAILLDFKRKHEQIKHSLTIAEVLNGDLATLPSDVLKTDKVTDESIKKDTSDEVPMDTKAISLSMFQDGSSIEQIAQKRGMVAGTIYGHLINFVGEEIEAEDLIDKDKLDRVVAVLKEHDGKSSSEIKVILGKDFDYPDIRIGQKVLGLG
ncbi:helix-turn-helix domain-containing protein [Sphingobacterium corticis]|uniref:Helix-turn-helix domain-containing protein n=1 Tax=Sphingobacterium corticis TaxID=1812823 RepID=A0ABW5NIV3_9SPHI